MTVHGQSEFGEQLLEVWRRTGDEDHDVVKVAKGNCFFFFAICLVLHWMVSLSTPSGKSKPSLAAPDRNDCIVELIKQRKRPCMIQDNSGR